MKKFQCHRYLIILVIQVFFRLSSAQEIVLFSGRDVWHADSLCDIEYTGCDWLTLHNGASIGYGYHPNGELWDVLFEYDANDQYYLTIYSLNVHLCKYKLLYSFPMPENWYVGTNSINIDYLGRIYLMAVEYDPISSISKNHLVRISHLEVPQFENLITVPNAHQFNDLHFQDGKIYIPEIFNPVIQVYDTNFILLYSLPTSKHISGLTSFSNGCDSVITYSANLDITTPEVYANGPDSICWISKYDLGSNILSPICSFNMHRKGGTTCITSPLEFLSSDPECDLLIDLDRDNSSGVYPYDYFDSTSYCTTLEAPIADQDLYIHTSAPLDSIQLTISSILDPSQEFLSIINLPPGFSFIMRDDSTYVLLNPGASDALYRSALLSIRYQHLIGQRTPGQRKIIIQGFNAIKAGKKITATIHLHAVPYAGIDASLLFCRDTIISQLSVLTQGQAGGVWQPSLTSGGNQLNTAFDLSNQYAYIVSDPVCGTDTAIVTISRDTSSHPDILGPDKTLCPGETLTLVAAYGASSILWDDGTAVPDRTVSSPGHYWISTATSGGCTFKDSIDILQGDIWNAVIESTDPTCHQANGVIDINPQDFASAASILFNQVPLQTNPIENLGAGNYSITGISHDGCKTQYTLTLTAQPVISVTLDTTITLLENTWQSVPYSILNNVNLLLVQFNPTTSIKWNGSDIEVYGDVDRHYEVSFIDENGCTEKHVLQTHVEQVKGIYIPNIFRPESVSGNSHWTTTIYLPYQLELVRVYDRWGNMLYQSADEINWDGDFKGKVCSSGVYVYQVILKDLGTGEKKTLLGDLTLIH